MKSKTIIKWTIVFILVIFAYWFVRRFLQITPEELQKMILSFGIISPLIYIGLYTVKPVVFFPSSVLAVAGGLAFGFIKGSIYILIGSAGAAATAYFIAQYFFSERFAEKNLGDKADKIRDKLKSKGFFYVLLMRLLPVFNYDLVSYLAGLTRVKFKHYMAASMLGVLPGTLTYAFVGSSIVSPNFTYVFIILFVLLICGLGAFWKRDKIKEILE